ncbi:MAG: hypothetical protein P8175_14960, partial [Deltaproteobacteria bacterium]
LNKPRGFRKADLSIFAALSGPVAVAIENALLYSNLENLVEERTRDLKDTEGKLKESEARFKSIFDNMSSGAIVYRAHRKKSFLHAQRLQGNQPYRHAQAGHGNRDPGAPFRHPFIRSAREFGLEGVLYVSFAFG